MDSILIPVGWLVAWIDERDLDRVQGIDWAPMWSDDRYYARAWTWDENRGSKSTVLLHRFILNAPRGSYVDHIDGDSMNCRRGNLRLATSRQNNANSYLAVTNTSGFKGVYWNKPKRKWQAYISLNNKSKYIGRFHDIEDAARAYDDFARREHGEFARLNFPREGERGAIILAD